MKLNQRVAFWRNQWVKWSGWAFAALVSYLVLYPMLILLMEKWLPPEADVPESVSVGVNLSIGPIVWLAEKWPLYSGLIDWIDSLVFDH